MIFLSKLKVFGEVNVRHYDPLNTLTNTYFCMTFETKPWKYFFNWVETKVENNEVNAILKIKVKRFKIMTQLNCSDDCVYSFLKLCCKSDEQREGHKTEEFLIQTSKHILWYQ